MESRAVRRRYLGGHTDFVKAMVYHARHVVVEGKQRRRDWIISGGADGLIIIWDVDRGDKLLVLKGHIRGILDLVVDPFESSDDDDEEEEEELGLFSASSDREIRRWSITRSETGIISGATTATILAHETSVNRLRFDSDGDLWTASADKTTRCLSRHDGWTTSTNTLVHPDFVKDVVILNDRIITACRDEEIRVWDRAEGTLLGLIQGHFEEVIGLVWLSSSRNTKGDTRRLISVSIDGTLRRWSIETPDLVPVGDNPDPVPVLEDEPVVKSQREQGLTEEEERELAELLSDEEG